MSTIGQVLLFFTVMKNVDLLIKKPHKSLYLMIWNEATVIFDLFIKTKDLIKIRIAFLQ